VSWQSFEENASQINVQNFSGNINIGCTIHQTLYFTLSANVLLDKKKSFFYKDDKLEIRDSRRQEISRVRKILAVKENKRVSS